MPLLLNKALFLLLWLLIPAIWIILYRSALTTLSRRRKLLIGGLRTALILLLGLALAEPRIRAHTDRVNVMFCLDVSESIGSDKKPAAEAFVQQTLTAMDKEDQAGLILFGKHPTLESPLQSELLLNTSTAYLNPNFTNLAEALRLAIGNLPQVGENIIVLFSDGNENIGQAVDLASLAASLGIKIFPAPLTSWFGQGEVFIQGVEMPPSTPLETPFEIRVVVVSSKAGQGNLTMLKNDTLLANQAVELRAGKNVLTFRDTLTEPGLYRYKAVINAPDDLFFQNNEGLAFISGAKKSQILYLAEETRLANPLTRMLTAQGFQLVPKRLNELTGSLHDLLEYNAVMLDNVSGQALPFAFMENLETYVKEMGGGLIMIGGDQSFGAGLYKETPVEKALPVFMDAPTDMTFSGLCLVFVIDKSSSMTTRYAGKSKLEMAKIAAFSSVELLNPMDSVGIVAFDSKFEWFVPITKASERQNIADHLLQFRESGGTDMYPALDDTFKVLQNVQATRKHVIVLSDGMTQDADFQTLVQNMSKAGISVSTVAIGKDADTDLLSAIAEWGQGRSYYTDDPSAIPTIFTGETRLVAQELIREQAMQPTPIAPHDMLQGIDVTRLPRIYGQIVTYPKPGAHLLINTVQGPLLAAWQYGLGRSVAFTSDLSGRWGKDWVQWEHYGAFTAQMVAWAQRKETQRRYAATITRAGEEAAFTVDVLDVQNRFVNQLNLQATMRTPANTTQTFDLTQIAPGRYETAFPAEQIGEYYVTLHETQTGTSGSPPEVFGFGIPYTDEFTSTDVNMPLLERLAAMTKGTVLTLEDPPQDLFTVHADDVRDDGTPLWPHFALAALFLLLVDVAVRKVLTLG